MPQHPLENWHFTTPYPESGPMSREVRDWWLAMVMDCAHAPAASPKAETPRPDSPERREQQTRRGRSSPMSDARHHHAVQIVFVGGSPKKRQNG